MEKGLYSSESGGYRVDPEHTHESQFSAFSGRSEPMLIRYPTLPVRLLSSIMSWTVNRPHKAWPWPWGQPSVLTAAKEPDYPPNSWLWQELGEELGDADADYADSDRSGSTERSDESHQDISDSELTDIRAGAVVRWCSCRTSAQEKIEEREDLPRQIAELVRAEQASAAAYDPDAVAALVTELYELLVTMGHWPEGSIHYPPHTTHPVNEGLAAELGYSTSAIALMLRLPYVDSEANQDEEGSIIDRTRFADYTLEEDLTEGRRPYPFRYLDGCPDLDPWMLPLVLPRTSGWHIMLDTHLGVVRAYGTDRSPPQHAVEWRRHGEVTNDGDERDRITWTEYRRAPLVHAAQYFLEIIDAYRSLARVPLIDARLSDPMQKREYRSGYPSWIVNEVRTALPCYPARPR